MYEESLHEGERKWMIEIDGWMEGEKNKKNSPHSKGSIYLICG